MLRELSLEQATRPACATRQRRGVDLAHPGQEGRLVEPCQEARAAASPRRLRSSGASVSRARARANASTSPAGTTTPASPTASGFPGPSETTIASPACIASSTAKESPSRADGLTNIVRRAEQPGDVVARAQHAHGGALVGPRAVEQRPAPRDEQRERPAPGVHPLCGRDHRHRILTLLHLADEHSCHRVLRELQLGAHERTVGRGRCLDARGSCWAPARVGPDGPARRSPAGRRPPPRSCRPCCDAAATTARSARRVAIRRRPSARRRKCRPCMTATDGRRRSHGSESTAATSPWVCTSAAARAARATAGQRTAIEGAAANGRREAAQRDAVLLEAIQRRQAVDVRLGPPTRVGQDVEDDGHGAVRLEHRTPSATVPARHDR